MRTNRMIGFMSALDNGHVNIACFMCQYFKKFIQNIMEIPSPQKMPCCHVVHNLLKRAVGKRHRSMDRHLRQSKGNQ
jgi:hypothetical protein